MTANVITYRGKSASREAGKALGFDAETIGRLSSLVATWEWRGPTDTLEHSFRNAGFDLKHHRIAKYLQICFRMQDLPRHLGHHSPGTDRGQDDEPLHEAETEKRSCHLSASFAGAGLAADARCAAVSRAIDPHRHGHREFHRRRSRRVAACHRHAAFERAHEA